MSIIASGVIGLSGLMYVALGASMLAARLRLGDKPIPHPLLATLYPSLFRRFQAVYDEQEPVGDELGMGTKDPRELVNEDLSFRLLAYLLLLLGLGRLASACFWGCAFIGIGLGSCVAEIAIVSNELLRHESVFLHRAMGVLMETVVVSLLYIGFGLPYCG